MPGANDKAASDAQGGEDGPSASMEGCSGDGVPNTLDEKDKSAMERVSVLAMALAQASAPITKGAARHAAVPLKNDPPATPLPASGGPLKSSPFGRKSPSLNPAAPTFVPPAFALLAAPRRYSGFEDWRGDNEAAEEEDAEDENGSGRAGRSRRRSSLKNSSEAEAVRGAPPLEGSLWLHLVTAKHPHSYHLPLARQQSHRLPCRLDSA